MDDTERVFDADDGFFENQIEIGGIGRPHRQRVGRIAWQQGADTVRRQIRELGRQARAERIWKEARRALPFERHSRLCSGLRLA